VGDAKRRSRSRAEILARETRCVYCANTPASLEHMPPRVMFTSKYRPSGMEYACCSECNRGTSAADLVASFLARLSQGYTPDATLLTEAMTLRGKIAQMAPGILEELFRPEKQSHILSRGSDGIIKPYIKFNADGPLAKTYLTVFSAKLGMALYREHIGQSLPLTGGVYTLFFLNAGLAQKTGDAILEKLPVFDTLVQGRINVLDQFAYRFNTDKRTIVAALAGFHSNFHVFTVATSDPDFYDPPKKIPYADFVRPGELVSRIPHKIRVTP
jgi:hypothetical protein